MISTYTLDGQTTVFQFNWPYLDRSHIMVTVDLAARPFKFINDHTISVKSLFGEPLPEGGVLKIFRVTPDLDAFAEFKDAANLSAQDLNRARLQCLYLIQERSGGLGGSVGSAVQLLVNEIETISGALDTLAFSQGVLTAGLQTLDELGDKITRVDNEGTALRETIEQAIADFDASTGSIETRMDSIEASQGNLQASVASSINTLVTANMAQASRVDSLEAKVDAIDVTGTEGEGEDAAIEALSASLIQSAIASVKNGAAQAKRIDSLEAKVGDDLQALIQTEQEVRASADEALASQITTLQAQIDDNIAQVIEDMQANVDVVNGKVTNLNAQYTLKVQVERPDGKPIMAGIGLAATSNDDLSKSEIVMMANRLVFADSANPNGPLKPMFVAGNVDGSPTFIIPSNVMGDRAYPGRLLVDGSIEGRSVAANTITGDKLVAGAITTREVNVNLGINILPNSNFVDRTNGLPTQWSFGGSTASATFGYAWGINLDPIAWTVGNSNVLWMHNSLTNGDQNIGGAQLLTVSDYFTVEPGQRYEFSVYSGAHRCAVDIYMDFWTAGNVGLGGSAIDATATNNREAQGSNILSAYKRIGGFITAPAGASKGRIVIRKGLATTAEVTSYAFLCQPMVAAAMPNQTRLSPWSVSGLGTFITPGGISTPSLSALSANIGLLRTAASGARVEIESNQIRVYDSNNVMRVRMGVW